MPVTPAVTSAWHERDAAWLCAQMREPFEGHTVIITHRPPLWHDALVPPEYRGSGINDAYLARGLLARVTAAARAAARAPPVAWLAGHVHVVSNLLVGPTLVAVNACGYGGESTGWVRVAPASSWIRVTAGDDDAAHPTNVAVAPLDRVVVSATMLM